ncbi:hypothetical protein AVEN_45915-1 [Araneus ventricosus]|uniref:PHD-type domain-containing protein n=1 Tax=Araneus ventricosus TaxID=182803 RepID=A0A4Y2E8Q5_ARAVE|nr:hypothetical protein AVEN_45915-1 [Araneus ventricosus]
MEEPVISSDEEQESDDACIFCNDLYSNSKDREEWIQCNRYRCWAHEACSSAEEGESLMKSSKMQRGFVHRRSPKESVLTKFVVGLLSASTISEGLENFCSIPFASGEHHVAAR